MTGLKLPMAAIAALTLLAGPALAQQPPSEVPAAPPEAHQTPLTPVEPGYQVPPPQAQPMPGSETLGTQVPEPKSEEEKATEGEAPVTPEAVPPTGL